MSGPIFLEFVGLSGAGKSTLADLVVKELRKEGKPVINRAEVLGDEKGFLRRQGQRLLYVIIAWLSKPALSLRAIGLVAEGRQPGGLVALKLCWNLWTVIGFIQSYRRQRGGTVVLSQGILQAMQSARWSAAHQLPMKHWIDYLRAFEPADFIFVVVDVQPSIARTRFNNRQDKWARIRSDDEHAWDRLTFAFSEIRETLLQKDRYKTIEIDNIGDASVVAKKITDLYNLLVQKAERL